MTPDQWIDFEEMLTPEQCAELGISQDRPLSQCLVRLAGAYRAAVDRNAALVAALDDLLGCPTITDRATCPNRDPSRIDEAPEWQAVLQISCAWTRYKRLKALATPAKCKTCGGSGMTAGWVPTYENPDNSGGDQAAEPCPDCDRPRK